jgi:hypothetical protein
MVIEYKIKFENGGVTVTQSVDAASDAGGTSLEEPPDPGGTSLEEGPDPGGTSLEEGPDPGGAGLGQAIAIAFGPVIIFRGGAGARIPGESVKNIPVVPVPPADPPTR